ncbi:TRAP transporter substrate-binding protein DctP [Ferviditalea candida]|uniref:TRAP transporter substrate-binding protein DctP n=1 Tax=Ferviditalea candida TaxID=3108399 RepID=A0ABU5ZK71_9BACL|nr:TRAP transporter substrate-binding protein DctP [Paenibacillaceae bacterium T2]
MRRKTLFLILSLILLSALVGCSSQSAQQSQSPQPAQSAQPAQSGQPAQSPQAEAPAAKEIVLKAVTAWPQKTADNAGLFALIEKVNVLGKGKVQIKYIGGPEVVPTMNQINAVKDGTIDIAWLSAGYTDSLVPAANAIKLSKLTPQEERDKGVTDLWNEIFKQANARFIVRGSAPDVHFHLYTVKPIKSLEDFKGVPIRVTAAYKDFVTALKAAPVATTPGEVYSALERKVVEGYGWPAYGIGDFGWDKLTKYVIDPGFYQVDCIGLMNLEKWNSLPKDVQDIFTQASIEVEKDMAQHFDQLAKDDRKKITGEGIQVITLDANTAKTYVDMAYKSVWDTVMKTDPANGPKIKQALGQ